MVSPCLASSYCRVLPSTRADQADLTLLQGLLACLSAIDMAERPCVLTLGHVISTGAATPRPWRGCASACVACSWHFVKLSSLTQKQRGLRYSRQTTSSLCMSPLTSLCTQQLCRCAERRSLHVQSAAICVANAAACVQLSTRRPEQLLHPACDDNHLHAAYTLFSGSVPQWAQGQTSALTGSCHIAVHYSCRVHSM